MVSPFPADFPGDSFVRNPFPPFEPGSPPWEHHEPDLAFHPTYTDEPVPYGSESSNPAPNPGPLETIRSVNRTSNLGPNRRNSKKLESSGSDETSSLGPKIDERKLKRMISNRDSARRSRMRKQKHLENLRDQVNRREVVKRELKNRLRLVVGQTQLFCAENECLLSEAAVLRRRLADIRQVLLARLLLNSPHINNQGLYPIHSLIT